MTRKFLDARNPLVAFAVAVAVAVAVALSQSAPARAAELPQVGQKAADFTLKSVQGEEVRLSDLARQGPVVLLVLRGYPGYQCPLCSRQVGDFVGQAKNFEAAGAQVVMIYPGPAAELDQKAKQFLKGATLPPHFRLLLDPDYKFTLSYHLRWSAVRETAYPSTFVIDRSQIIRFAKISKTHGGRTSAEEVAKVAQGL